MATNDFKPFAAGAGANVMSQADYQALAALITGFQSGKASSAQVNKALRQATFVAAALAQYTANKSGLDVLDDGDLNGFISKMGTAFGKDFQALDTTLTNLSGKSISGILEYLGFGSFPQYQNLGVGQHIIQHGSGATNSSGIVDIVFPKAFTTTNNLNVIATATAITPSNYIITVGTPTLTGVRIYATGANAGAIPAASFSIGFNWFATGR